MTAVLALALAAASLDLPAYRARLEQIDALLAAGNLEQAAAAAKALESATIEGQIEPDRWALGPIARQTPHRARLRSLIEALGAKPGRAGRADLALLEQIRAAQAASKPGAGGEVLPLDAPGASLREKLQRLAEEAGSWALDMLERFFRWLAGFFPKSAPGSERGSGGGIRALVLVAVGVILLLVSALALLTRGRGVPLASQPVRRKDAADDDPLSRTVAGWEERAAQLAAEGRAREAIRAWYHAVLVRLAGKGLLHHRLGRTNWEYAHALPPAFPWRTGFADLTRRFDVEWYGRIESTGESLSEFAQGAREILRGVGQA